MRLTQDELKAMLVERFGEDPAAWAFRCPGCKDVASVADFRAAFAERPRTHRDGSAMLASDIIGQECIGRSLGAIDRATPLGEYEGRGCDWCAYGLIRGPWIVVRPDGGEFGCFPVADAPAEPTCFECHAPLGQPHTSECDLVAHGAAEGVVTEREASREPTPMPGAVDA